MRFERRNSKIELGPDGSDPPSDVEMKLLDPCRGITFAKKREGDEKHEE